MAFDITRFLLNRAIVERQGVPEDEATRLALVPSVLTVPLGVSAAVATVVGQRAASTPPPAEPSPDEPPTVVIPQLRGKRVEDAVARLDKLGLRPALGVDEAAEPGKVMTSSPSPGTPVPFGSWVVVITGDASIESREASPELSGAGRPG